MDLPIPINHMTYILDRTCGTIARTTYRYVTLNLNFTGLMPFLQKLTPVTDVTSLNSQLDLTIPVGNSQMAFMVTPGVQPNGMYTTTFPLKLFFIGCS